VMERARYDGKGIRVDSLQRKPMVLTGLRAGKLYTVPLWATSTRVRANWAKGGSSPDTNTIMLDDNGSKRAQSAQLQLKLLTHSSR
jgi:hypothetical protein